MTDLKTSDSLLRALSEASSRTLSAEELREQRVSFIMGSVDDKSGVTRARVKEILDEKEGLKTK